MNFLTDILLSLPHPFGVLLLCILAGFLGWFLPYVVLSWYEYKHPRIALFSGLFCLLIVEQFGEDIVIGKKRSEFIEGQVATLREDKMYAALFSHIPASEATLRAMLQERYQKLQNTHEDEKLQQLAEIRYEVMQGFFAEFLQSTGNTDLNNYLNLSFPQIYALKKTPELCVKYFLGVPDKAFTQQDEEWMDREEAIKYAVMVKSLRTPHYKEPQTREEVILGLVNAYRDIKWDETELEKFDTLLSLPPQEGCDIALHMYEAFLHMDPEIRARTYRFIMLEGNKYYRMQK